MSLLLRVSEIVGRPVVTLAGDDIAQLRDVVFDDVEGEVVGFTLAKRSRFGGRLREVLPWSAVVALGPDALMVADEGALAAGPLVDGADAPGHGEGDVLGDRVITDAGDRRRHVLLLVRLVLTMTNVSSADLTIGSPTTRGRENAGYGGLFWRGPRSFTGGTLLAPDFSGGEEIRGTRGPWMGFVGRHDETGGASTVVIVDGTDNPSNPPQWFARTEQFGCLNPAPFFSTEVPFAPGDTLRFRYAVVIADGASTRRRRRARGPGGARS